MSSHRNAASGAGPARDLPTDGMLDASTLAALKKALIDLEALLGTQLEAVRHGSEPVSLDEPIGRLSRMEAMAQQQMAKANVSASEKRLRAVHRALESMQRGDYGECRRCEEEISLARLRARPESALCLRCQSANEG